MQRIFLSGRKLTLSLFDDFSFRDEWSGLFNLDEKVLDYLAVKTERGWAAPENAVVERTVAGRGAVTFTHEINGHVVRIKIAMRREINKGIAGEALAVSVDGSRKNELEVGVCGRHAYDQNCGKVSIDGKEIRAGGNVMVVNPEGPGETPIVDAGPRVHRQGTKDYQIRVVRIPFEDQITLRVHHRPPRFVRAVATANTSFYSDSDEWNELYRRARETLRILTKRRGWYAGLPWFVQYWGRDTFISVPALVREGYAPLVRRTLLDFLYSKVEGEIPRLIRENGVPEFGSIDTNPLFLNAVADYVSLSGDYGFISDNQTDIVEALNWSLDLYGVLPRSNGKDTWMDTLEIRKNPVEVAAYIVEAIRKLSRLGAVEGSLYTEARQRWEAEKRKFLLERSANILLAATYNLVPPVEALALAKEWKLFSDWGVRSWSPLEAEYDPRGYHTGAVWGLTTAAGLYVALKAGDWATAERMRDALLARGKWTRYLDEVWGAKTGEPLGAEAQLWTAAMVIRAIDEVMIDARRIPPEIGRMRRARWQRGRLRHVSIE